MTRIAIVGSGISGLAAADLLGRSNEVVLFEREARAGGHSRTIHSAHGNLTVPVDTGFIVYNEVNYPLLTRLFAHLGVATSPSDMSFGVRYGDGELEFCSSSLGGLFAQKRNVASPRYWRMLRDILHFFRKAPGVLDEAADPNLSQLIEHLDLGTWFKERFLVPMGAAIWSTPPDQMLEFPAKTFVRFFQNHGLLTIKGHHPWRTVAGGSERYVERLAGTLAHRLRLSAPVTRIEKSGSGFAIVTRGGHRDHFDEVVLACHADAALALLAEPEPDERRVLGAFQFRDNTVVLHCDENLMPRAKAAWASWVYAAGGAETSERVSLTYWMNKLQNIPGQALFVSLNPDRTIRPETVIDRHVFRHPVFSRAAVAAQAAIPSIQGHRGLWFCGAWQRYGFHEDGLWSAVRIADAKGIAVPWL